VTAQTAAVAAAGVGRVHSGEVLAEHSLVVE